MFKNRAAQISFVKTPKSDSTETTKSTHRLNDAEINTIKSAAKCVGVFVLATIITVKFSDAICEIAVSHAAKK